MSAMHEQPHRSKTIAAIPIAAALVFALTTALLSARNGSLGRELRAERDTTAALKRLAAEEQVWHDVLAAPFARVSVLEPTTQGDPRMRSRATYDPTTRRAVVGCENFSTRRGREYRLWVIRDNAPASLGVIAPDADGRAMLRIEEVGDSPALSAFLISIEPEGETKPTTPSGPIVMLGRLSD